MARAGAISDKGLVSGIDPRARLVCLLIAAVPVSLTRSMPAAVLAAVLFGLALAASGLPARLLARRWLAVNAFILFLWLVAPWSTPGTPAWSWHGIGITHEGIALTALVSVKANALFLMFMSLAGSLSPSQLARGLRGLRVPDKLVLMILFSARGISLIEEEYRRLRESMRLRGFRPRTDLHTYRTFSALVAGLLVRAFRRAETLDEAMRLRGFCGEFHLPPLPPMRPRDWMAIGAGVLLSALFTAISLGVLP